MQRTQRGGTQVTHGDAAGEPGLLVRAGSLTEQMVQNQS